MADFDPHIWAQEIMNRVREEINKIKILTFGEITEIKKKDNGGYEARVKEAGATESSIFLDCVSDYIPRIGDWVAMTHPRGSKPFIIGAAPAFENSVIAGGTPSILTVQDVRDIRNNPDRLSDYDPKPNQLNDKAAQIFFGQFDKARWMSALTVKGWQDSDIYKYSAWQLIGIASLEADDRFYLRSGMGDTWRQFHEIWHSGNFNPNNYQGNFQASGNIVGNLRHRRDYMQIYPYSDTYDDGSFIQSFYTGKGAGSNPASQYRFYIRNADNSTRGLSFYAADFTSGSSERLKKDIKIWEDNILNIFREIDLYEYRLKEDPSDRKMRHGLVIGDKYKTPPDLVADGDDSISHYEFISYVAKGVKELVSVTDDQQTEIKDLKSQLETEKQERLKLEERLAQLEQKFAAL